MIWHPGASTKRIDIVVGEVSAEKDFTQTQVAPEMWRTPYMATEPALPPAQGRGIINSSPNSTQALPSPINCLCIVVICHRDRGAPEQLRKGFQAISDLFAEAGM
jgi:hypothetical protein